MRKLAGAVCANSHAFLRNVIRPLQNGRCCSFRGEVRSADFVVGNAVRPDHQIALVKLEGGRHGVFALDLRTALSEPAAVEAP